MTAARLDRLLSQVENAIAVLALAAATILSVVAVILRYVFDYVIFWSQEASLYLVILSTFVGASIALRHNDHVGVDFLARARRGRGKKVVRVVGALVTLVYCGLFGFVAWVMVTSPVVQSYETPSLYLPLWVVQLCVPVGLMFMLIRSLQILYRTLRGRDPYPDAAQHASPEQEPAT